MSPGQLETCNPQGLECLVLMSKTPLRVQVTNNHMLTQNLYYNYYYPKPKYLTIGYLDHLGSPVGHLPGRIWQRTPQVPPTYLWLAANEGMKDKMETTRMGYIGTTITKGKPNPYLDSITKCKRKYLRAIESCRQKQS